MIRYFKISVKPWYVALFYKWIIVERLGYNYFIQHLAHHRWVLAVAKERRLTFLRRPSPAG